MSERAGEIADHIARGISTSDDPHDVFQALFDCLVFGLAQLCPECRRAMAASIGDQMLEAAEKCAADSADLEPIYPCPHPRLH
jgi:hypothetical protein